MKYCQEEQIIISSPINNFDFINSELAQELANQGIDIYNSSDSFFNDICSSFTSTNNTDILLGDRRKYL